MKMCIE
jgi:ATP-dependent RNA helicase DDX23/PRP28